MCGAPSLVTVCSDVRLNIGCQYDFNVAYTISSLLDTGTKSSETNSHCHPKKTGSIIRKTALPPNGWTGNERQTRYEVSVAAPLSLFGVI